MSPTSSSAVYIAYRRTPRRLGLNCVVSAIHAERINLRGKSLYFMLCFLISAARQSSSMLSFMSDDKKEKERAVEREEKKGERKGDARRGDEEKIARTFLTSRSNKASPLKTDHQTHFFQFLTCFSGRGEKP